MAEQQATEWSKQWAKVVAQAWTDEAYKERLVANPAAVLAEEGIAVPEGVVLRVVQDTDKEKHVVLPSLPTDIGSAGSAEARISAIYNGPCSPWLFCN